MLKHSSSNKVVRMAGHVIAFSLFLAIFATINPTGLAQDDPHYGGGSVATPNLILQDLGFCANEFRAFDSQSVELSTQDVRLSELQLETIRLEFTPTGACTISIDFLSAN